MPVSFQDLLSAFEFASFDGGGNQAFVNKESGETYIHSEFGDNFEELPEDIEDNDKYLRVPDRRDLDLGKPLVLDFAREFLPDDFDHVRGIFSRSGAYARFKDLLRERRAIDKWHQFENQATEKALREWCAENSIELVD